MPGANLYMLPRQLYHVTHRCHDRSFLLKLAKDRHDYRRLAIDISGTHGIWILNDCLINQKKLIAWTGYANLEQFRKHDTQDFANRIQHRILQRESQWTDAVAVGTAAFIQSVTDRLPDRRRWQIEETTIGRSAGSTLREPTPAYMHFSAPKNAAKTL